MDSCIYEGRVRHTRRTPAEHSFEYRLFLMYLDLEELPRLFSKRWLWSASGPAVARFRRSDHIGDPAMHLFGRHPQVLQAEGRFAFHLGGHDLVVRVLEHHTHPLAHLP